MDERFPVFLLSARSRSAELKSVCSAVGPCLCAGRARVRISVEKWKVKFVRMDGKGEGGDCAERTEVERSGTFRGHERVIRVDFDLAAEVLVVN